MRHNYGYHPLKLLRLIATALCIAACPLTPAAAQSTGPESERIYLSGKGPSDAVPWDFTVTGGRRAGEATTIPVPSNWEQQGFGTYEYGQLNTRSANEHGLYRLHFGVPERLKGKRLRIVFEGVMTDAQVRLNGQLLGPVHQGGFYRFHYDISDAVNFAPGKPNLLEVDVSKVSANAKTERAERGGDYWIFGGIFRPVWIEARPEESIETVAVDARADGALSATVTISGDKTADRLQAVLIDAAGRPVASPVDARVPHGGAGRVTLATRYPGVAPWTAETPALYSLRLTLFSGDTALHQVTTRVGFRTFEVRPGDGLYLNGKRILLKGVNRHAFRPDTGRALDPSASWEDVCLIRSMNMNAVRMSHYPPDEALLEAADTLGLYVIDELSGWQAAHDTQVGRLLVRAMIERDVNHPSILFWANGNEGGFNRDLDADYTLWDTQRRHVLHPWELHDDVDTKHYPDYAELTKKLAGPNIVMPTEMIHALNDGGGASALADYWRAIRSSPVGGGGFIWALFDEGIARTDRNGAIDVFGDYAPDGLVGPRHEKEASYFAVRDIWSPIVVTPPVLDAAFNGQLAVRNEQDFLPLDAIKFAWTLRHFADANGKGARIYGSGIASVPAATAPGATASLALDLPKDWRKADALELVATRGQDMIRSWTWPINDAPPPARLSGGKAPTIERTGDAIVLHGGKVAATFDARTGLLRQIARDGKALSLNGGPLLDWARPDGNGDPVWTPFARAGQAAEFVAPEAKTQNLIEFDLAIGKDENFARFKLEISPDGQHWTTIFNKARRPYESKRIYFAPTTVKAIRFSGVQRTDGSPIDVNGARAGFQPSRFPANEESRLLRADLSTRDGAASAEIETRGGGFQALRWTMHGDGTLDLSYRYTLDGPVLFHGVSFAQATDRILAVRQKSDGPRPVWNNRREGVQLGVHDIAWDQKNAAPLIERTGYYSGFRWVRVNSRDGDWMVSRVSGPDFLRVGTRLADHGNISVDFPRGDISFLNAIPAMGSKFVLPQDSGPEGQPSIANGTYEGQLRFSFP